MADFLDWREGMLIAVMKSSEHFWAVHGRKRETLAIMITHGVGFKRGIPIFGGESNVGIKAENRCAGRTVHLGYRHFEARLLWHLVGKLWSSQDTSIDFGIDGGSKIHCTIILCNIGTSGCHDTASHAIRLRVEIAEPGADGGK